MHIDTFEKIAKQVAELKKTGLKFDVTINDDVTWVKESTGASFAPTYYEVTSLAQLSQLQGILGKPVNVMRPDQAHLASANKVIIADFKPADCTTSLTESIKSERDFMVTRQKFPSVKFFTHNIRNLTALSPILISSPPSEKVEDGITYRFIGTPTSCEMCVPHDSQLYNYLDKGFVYTKLAFVRGKDKTIITNELTPDTYLVMLGCYLHHDFTKLLDNECFLNYNKARLVRVKIEKDLPPQHKALYDKIRNIVLTDYEKSVNSNMLVKVQKGELPSATYNHIKITKNSFTYEGISIEAEGMLAYLNDNMIFDDRTDIYTIIGAYLTGKLGELNSAVLKKDEPTNVDGVITPAPEKELEQAFKINGIDISIKRTTANTRRTINGVAINLEELDPVCYRASCFDNQEIFDKFVASVNEMSLKWHDAIGAGLPVKIHDGLTALEYKTPEPPISCPRIRFLKEKDGVYLITGEGKDDHVKVKLNYVMKQIAMINRKTNNIYSVGEGYSPRNAAWARRQLTKVLKKGCTFETKTLIVDAEGKPALDANNKKTYTVTSECLLTDDKAEFIGKMSATFYEKAVQRSKTFLENAVMQTGARTIEFAGEECWYVEGTLHKYAVSKKTNNVFNFEMGRHICIVEPGHRVEIGFDATAARLLALKNDSVTVAAVSTLRHA